MTAGKLRRSILSAERGAKGAGAVHISFHPSLAGRVEVKWPMSLQIATQAGFDAIDIELREIPHSERNMARKRLDSLGIKAGVAPLPVEFRADDASYERDLAGFPEIVHLAKSLGIGVMTRALPPSSEFPMAEISLIMRRRLLPVVEILERNEMRLALEFIGPLHMRKARRHEVFWRMGDTLAFIESLGPSVGLLLDSWHWHHVGATRQDIVDAGNRVINVQVADAADLSPANVRDNERLLPGQGVIDLPEFLAGLRSIDYGGLVTPEVFGYQGTLEDPIGSARAALRATRDVLSKM
jgi:sugar phosphate isomerase/epimerase